MPEQTNIISGGVSPLVKTARPGRADLAAGAETSGSKGPVFSNDLDQARQRQSDAVNAEPAKPGKRTEDRPVSAAVTKNTAPPASNGKVGREDGRLLLQDSPVDDSVRLDAAGNTIPADSENSAVSLLTASGQPTRESTGHSPSPMMGQAAGQLMSESTGQAAGHIGNESTVRADGQTLTGAAGSNTVAVLDVPATADAKRTQPQAVLPLEQQSTVATTAVSQAASAVRAAIGAPGDKQEAAVLQATPAAHTRQPSSGPDAGIPVEAARAIASDTPVATGSSPATATVTGSATTTVTTTAAISTTAAATKAATTAATPTAATTTAATTTAATTTTAAATSSPATANVTGSIATTAATVTSTNSATADNLLASAEDGRDVNEALPAKQQLSDSAVPKRPMENGAATTSAATLAKARSAETVQGAVLTAPETLTSSGQADKTFMLQANAVELTQSASGNGIVTQATLAGRFRQLSGDMAARGANTPKTAAAQAALPGLSVRLPEHRSVVEELPPTLAEDSLSDMNSLVAATEAKVTVQQRIATAEAMLSQMAQEGNDVAGKVRTADNMLLAVAGSTASTPMAQQVESTAGPIVQAPLNLNLTSADADTALAGNVKWMTNEGVKNAVMTVTPHGMGPISVKIGIDGDQMDVSIIASQHSTRDALESMLPRLREQLAVQGHDMVKVDVSDGKGEQSRSANGQSFAESRNPAGTSSQDSQRNSSNHGEKTESGRLGASEVVQESFMAEDLQRVAARAIGEVGSRPVFDAYV